MKKIIMALCMALTLTACTYENEHGKCVGVADDKRPDLNYRLEVMNVFWAVVGIEIIYPPIKVLADATFCPTGKKSPAGKVAP